MAGRMAGQLAEVRAGDVMLTWEPLYHIGGSQVIVTCLQYGMPMALLERFSASAFWDEARRYRATQMHYLAMHADVEACAAIGVPSDVGDEDIKVFVKPLGGKRLDPLDLIRWCERHLAYFQIPRYCRARRRVPADTDRAHPQGPALDVGDSVLGSRALRIPDAPRDADLTLAGARRSVLTLIARPHSMGAARLRTQPLVGGSR